MFVKRNPGRKGPSNRQVYVPHDQRELNPSPIPIRTQKEAEFYYKQLQGMGLINPPTDNYKPEIIIIKKVQQNTWITFDMNETDQSIKTSTIRSSDCDAYDIYGNKLDKTKYDLVNILNQTGYKLYPILCTGALTFYNGTAVSRNMYSVELNGNRNTIPVAAETNYRIYNDWPDFVKAYPCHQNGDLLYCCYSDSSSTSTPVFFNAYQPYFNARCYEITCIVVPQ